MLLVFRLRESERFGIGWMGRGMVVLRFRVAFGEYYRFEFQCVMPDMLLLLLI